MLNLTRPMLRKVPDVTLFFWMIKLLTTALGESTSDYFIYTYNPYIVVITAFIGFIIILALQFLMRKYIPWVYWLTVVMVAVFGTMAADVVHVVLGVPYMISTGVFAAALVAIFVLWLKTEKTLSIHSITTTRRELFYWATVSATFALGTAAGDLLAYSAHLGFFATGVVFVALFGLIGLGHWLFRIPATIAFWLAYILTRPIGASFADWTGKPPAVGGLGWGDLPVIVALTVLIISLVIYLTLTHEDVDKKLASR